MKPTEYEQDLIEWLKDPENAAEYLNAAILENDTVVMALAMRRVAAAQGGIASLAQRANVKRERLYPVLSMRGSPTVGNLFTLLNSMGFRLSVQPK